MSSGVVIPKNRLDYISFIQFIGVISVIFGHSMNSIDVPPLLTDIKAWVYTFHMPLFFLVSAYLFAFLGGFERKGYKKTFIAKFKRLLLPYFIWNVIFFFPKIILKDYIPDTVEYTPEFFFKIFLCPRENILGHTWFLAALFEMYVLAIVFEIMLKHKQLWIPTLMVLSVVYCFGVGETFLAIGDLMKNAVYFFAGLLLGQIKQEDVIAFGKDNKLFWALILLTIGFSLVWAFNRTMLENRLMLGFCIILFLGVIQIRFGIKWNVIEFVSRNAFCIYIIHWPILMVIRLIVYQKLHFAPIVSMICMFIGGIAVALGVTWLLRQFKTPLMKKINQVVFGM